MAFVWLYAGMSSAMSHELSGRDESLHAYPTLVRSLSSMSTLMNGQMSQLPEVFFALIALVRFFTDVQPLVACKGRRICEK